MPAWPAGSPAASSRPSLQARAVEGVLAAVAGDAQLRQAQDATPAGPAASMAARMFCRLPAQSSGVWLSTAAATRMRVMAS